MLKKLWLNLQLFADGGDGSGDGGSASASTGEALGGNKESGENDKILASIPEKAKKYYQKAMEKHSGSTTEASTQNSDNGQPTNDQSTAEKIPYDDLIKSDEY